MKVTKSNKIFVNNDDVERFVADIVRQINQSNWRPDYIVGITRGGLLPANLISQYLDVPMHSLGVSLRDNNNSSESNFWMAEDAYGYIEKDSRENVEDSSNSAIRKNILIVDDINDSGATLNWIREDWKSGCLPDDVAWNEILGKGGNVRTAVIFNNEASDYTDIDYAGVTINKAEEDQWVVFPWEEWWKAKPNM